jgi:hypothetical protein
LRLERTFERLAESLRNNDVLFRPAEQTPVGQETPIMAGNEHRIGATRNRTQHPPYRSETSCDTLTTPAALAAFTQHLADVNEARRKSRLRKSLRGVPGEQEVA